MYYILYTAGTNYTHDLSAQILKKINSSMDSIESIKVGMLTNNESHPGDGIAPRKDLDDTPFPYGLIDCKISS